LKAIKCPTPRVSLLLRLQSPRRQPLVTPCCSIPPAPRQVSSHSAAVLRAETKPALPQAPRHRPLLLPFPATPSSVATELRWPLFSSFSRHRFTPLSPRRCEELREAPPTSPAGANRHKRATAGLRSPRQDEALLPEVEVARRWSPTGHVTGQGATVRQASSGQILAASVFSHRW
jgi:hypothetical protein